MTKEKLLR